MMMQRQLQVRRLVQCSRRRHLSSPTIVRQPMTAPPSQPPVVVSRQGWQAYRTKHPIKKDLVAAEKNKKKKDATDDMPWPKSVVNGAYAAAFTLIPYFSVWYVSANPGLREMIEPYLSVQVIDFVRGHFGKPDLDALSYADVIEGGENETAGTGSVDKNRDFFHKIPIPHILPYEFTERVRREQEAIQQQSKAPVNVKIQVVDDGDNSFMSKQDVNVQKVPGSTPARVEALLALITPPSSSSSSSTSATTTAASKSNLPAIAVDFLPDDDDNDNDTQDNGGTTFSNESSSSSLQSMDSESSTGWSNMNMTTGSSSAGLTASTREKTVDPLQQTAHIFSSWHYQPPANVPNTSNSNSSKGSSSNNNSSSSSSSSVSMDDIERSRLEYTVKELQQNLKDPNCLRSVDDMMDELKVAKAELSRLKWNKWGWKK